MPGNDGIAGRLGEQTAKIRPLAAGAVEQDVERVQHAVNIERRRLDRHDDKIARPEASNGRVRAETRCIDNDGARLPGEMVRCPPAIRGGVLNDPHAPQSALAAREARDRPLRIGIDDGGTAPFEMPVDCKAAGERALAAAALHGRYRDDRTRHLPVSLPAGPSAC